jgi:anti-sigma factor ChrR (cupin superfamily)
MSDALTLDELAILDGIAVESIEPIEPPPAVRLRILSAIRQRQPLDTSVPGAHESFTIRDAEGRWKEIAPGARIKKLSADAKRGTMTCLMELAPLALVPAHDHDGGEDSYVIRGSCRIGSLALNLGDFHHSDPGSHHGDIVASEEGCLLLITVDVVKAA